MNKFRKSKYNCFVYALGLSADQDFIYFDNDGPKIILGGCQIEHLIKYGVLDLTNIPQKNDFIVYKRNGTITHMGIVQNAKTIISKWGTENDPIEHRVKDAFSKYGSDVSYYKYILPDAIKKYLTTYKNAL